jgi:hypothetical protein
MRLATKIDLIKKETSKSGKRQELAKCLIRELNLPHRHGPINCVDWFPRFLLPCFLCFTFSIRQICPMSNLRPIPGFLLNQAEENSANCPSYFGHYLLLVAKPWSKLMNEFLLFHNSESKASCTQSFSSLLLVVCKSFKHRNMQSTTRANER